MGEDKFGKNKKRFRSNLQKRKAVVKNIIENKDERRRIKSIQHLSSFS